MVMLHNVVFFVTCNAIREYLHVVYNIFAGMAVSTSQILAALKCQLDTIIPDNMSIKKRTESTMLLASPYI